MRKILLSVVIMFTFCNLLEAQQAKNWRIAALHKQTHFEGVIPPGNYSGITPLGNDVYAIVSDKSDSALYFNARLVINRQTGELVHAEWLGGHGKTDAKGLDSEAIAKVSDSTVVIATEGNARLKEWRIAQDTNDDKLTNSDNNLWEWSMDKSLFYPNYVFESLAYDSVRHRLWTINESTLRNDGKPASPQNPGNNILRLISFPWDDHTAMPTAYLYRMDMPTTQKTAQTYAMGVSELCALPDGQLLVLEREAFVPKMKIGAFCNCKLYITNPSEATQYPIDKAVEPGAPFVKKRLLTEWRTKLTLFSQSWANYEGMCLGPTLDNGDLTIILVSDSQDGYAGVLKDWFTTIVLTDK